MDKNKDNYAKDTLSFTVPKQYRNNNQTSRPQGERQPRPQGQQYYSQGQGQPRPHGQSKTSKSQGKSKHPQKAKTQSKKKNVNKKKHKSGFVSKLLISLLSFLLFVFIIYSVLVFLLVNKIEKTENGERIESSHELYSGSHVRNILLIGTDSRGEDGGRSDSMILLSLNRSTNKINMVSLMRDTYVQIPGYGSDKLNAAYAYGGADLLMDTIEENFYIEVDDYVSVSFMSFAGIVDAVGGVEVEISDEEADAINVLLDSKEGVKLFGTPDESDYLNGGGKYELNGKQALCYARLRKVGNADFERTERQRIVLTEIFKNISPTAILSLVGDAFPDVATNMSNFDLYLLSLRVPFFIGYDIEQLRIPAEDTYWNSDIGGQSVLEIDFDANIDIVENELYKN